LTEIKKKDGVLYVVRNVQFSMVANPTDSRPTTSDCRHSLCGQEQQLKRKDLLQGSNSQRRRRSSWKKWNCLFKNELIVGDLAQKRPAEWDSQGASASHDFFSL